MVELLPYVATQVNTLCSNLIATTDCMKTPGERLAFARESAGFSSAREAAIALGVSISTYNAHERAGQPGARTFKIDSARRYGKRFGVSAAWLLTGEGKAEPQASASPIEPMSVDVVSVRGVAQAGVWQEFEDFDGGNLEPVPTVPGRWRSFEQFAYKIAGTSMDRAGMRSGDYVICVPYGSARSHRANGDYVVVERRRGPAIERTVKRLKLVNNGFELWPESTDTRFQEPIFVKSNGDETEDDGTSIEIVGLVIGRWAPL